MTFFSGEYRGKVDAKGRLVLPSRLKASLLSAGAGEGSGGDTEVILRMGFEPNLEIYPPSTYDAMHSRVLALDAFDASSRAFKRNFFRGIAPLSVDSLGRVLLPRNFMQYAALSKVAVVVGVGDLIELWDEQKYEDYLFKDREAYSQLGKRLLDGKEKLP